MEADLHHFPLVINKAKLYIAQKKTHNIFIQNPKMTCCRLFLQKKQQHAEWDLDNIEKTLNGTNAGLRASIRG